jgi:hypothetical protein
VRVFQPERKNGRNVFSSFVAVARLLIKVSTVGRWINLCRLSSQEK